MHLLFALVVLTVCWNLNRCAADDSMTVAFPILPVGQVEVSQSDREAAETLFQKALDEADRQNGFDAMRHAVDALRRNPNHERIRTLFGYRIYEDEWRTEWEVDRLKKGFIDHEVFGWMPKEYVARYEAGERFMPGSGWVAAEEEARLRFPIRNGWTVATEHYDLRTNHSLEEGVRTARRLEHLHRCWKFLFFNYLYTDETLAKMFRGRSTPPPSPRHEVILYRNKEDYVANLREVEPRIAETNGFYFPLKKRAYFFPAAKEMDDHTADSVRQTLFHEGTHQLFQEVKWTKETPGRRSNFWLLEGIAMFMETFRIEDGTYRVGDIHNSRLYAAKVHQADHALYVPFAELVRMGRNDFQSFSHLARLYSQSAGATHFLMFAEEGRYRQAVITLLRQLYAGSDRLDSLSRLTGCSYKELDEKYVEFLKTVPE